MIIKCKMCGGDLRIEEGTTVAECEYCGTKQTVPNADNEKKIKLFERANRLRAACEFDKAAGVYESIVADFDTEAEAYWGLILCKFGIEYVDDPATGDKVPTCHRSSFDSVLEDPNFELVMENSDAISRKVYRDEAKAIEELRRSIIEVSSKEEPYDVFISYKELDASGERTIDSVIAQDIYKELTNEGYRVFFSRISLESKLGVEYEPYIFAALNSARVMIVVGTDYDNFNAVWVKNEWSRYLALIASGQKKTLIPCFKNIDAYDMPREFNKLAAQDMGKVGAMQDLLRGVEKLLSKNEGSAAVHSDSKSATEPLLTRAFMFLEDGNWKEADKYCEKVLDQEPENAQAYLGKLMAECCVRRKEDLKDCRESFDDSSNFEKVVRFGDKQLVDELESYSDHIYERNENDRLTRIYRGAVINMKDANTEEKFKAAAKKFESIHGFMDADEKCRQCLEKANERVYECSIACIKENSPQGYEKAISKLKSISGYKDSDEQLTAVLKKLEELRKNFEDVRNKFNDPDCTVGISFLHGDRIAAICSDDTMLAAGEGLRSDYLSSVPNGVLADMENGGEIKLRKVRDVYSGFNELFVVYTDGTAGVYFKRDNSADVSQWSNVVSISEVDLDTSSEIVGLRADGTLALCRGSKISCGELSQWTNISSTTMTYKDFFGISKDGTIKYFGEDSKEWRYLTAAKNVVRLKYLHQSYDPFIAVFYSDGSAEIVKRGSLSPEMKWDNAVDLDRLIDGYFVVLQGNGKVLAYKPTKVGSYEITSDGEFPVYKPPKDQSYEKTGDGEATWTDIVSICAGRHHVVGLKRDGTVVAEYHDPYSYHGQCDVSSWENIVAVYASWDSTLGVRADGSVVHCGSHDIITHGWSDLDWKLFDGIEDLEENIKRNKEFKASMERAAEEQREARKRAEKERKRAAEEARLARIAELEKEKQALQAEIPTIKGLFAAGKIKKLQARVDEIEIKLTKLK